MCCKLWDDARSNIEASVSAATNRRSRLLVDIRKAAIITARSEALLQR
jgi:hypothetical protein